MKRQTSLWSILQRYLCKNMQFRQYIFAEIFSGASRLVLTKKESSATAVEQCTHCTQQAKMFYGVSYSIITPTFSNNSNLTAYLIVQHFILIVPFRHSV